MRLFGNILWHFPFLGFLSALGTFLLGLLLTVLVIPAPIGLGLIQYSKFLLAPYSYSMVSKTDLGVEQNPLWKAYSIIIMIIYFPLGLFLALAVALQAGLLFLTLIGIPAAIPLVKSLGTFLNPVGKVCVPVAVGIAVELEREQKIIDEHRKKKGLR